MGRDRQLGVFALAVLGTVVIAASPRPSSLSVSGQYAVATMFFAAVLWVTRAIPLPVTALSIPALLTVFGVYSDLATPLSGFADPIIFLFLAGFMLANALQKYGIDRRIALWMMSRMGASARLLILGIMVATAFLSMWVSNTATTAMMTPIALGVLAQVVGRDEVQETGAEETFSNMQIATLLGTAYAASVGGVGTLIGTPPNAVVAIYLDRLLGYQVSFLDWLFIGLPIVVVTLPVVWYVLTFRLYPPEVDDVEGARAEARRYLEEEGGLGTEGRRVAAIFVVTAVLWVAGGLGQFFEPFLPSRWYVTLFGGTGPSLFGTGGHRGVLYFVLVGLYAVPALVLAGAMEWDDLADIDWGTILLFGGGIALADALADTGAIEWFASLFFDALVGAPIVLVVGAIVMFVIVLTELTSNTATTSIIAPLLIGIGSALAATLGLDDVAAAVFLSVAGAIAASYAFALPVSTPPNAIVFGSGYMQQEDMLRAGMMLNVIMTVLLTALISVLFYFVWPAVLW